MPFNSTQKQTNVPVNGGISPYGALSGVPLYATVSAKTAAYTVKESEFGVIFTNRGCTAAVAFTLPPVTNLPVGWWCIFYSVDNDGMSVASNGSNDNIVAKNDAGADSITMTTNSLAIGAGLLVIWDGTGWLTFQAGNGATYTVA